MHYIDDNAPLNYSRLELPLVHVTNDFDVLCKILSEGFKPSYCTEILGDHDRQLRAAFPMISFANLDVENAQRHMQSYGTFNIAMKKAWAQKNDFNPVLYLDRFSSYTSNLINSFDRLKNLYAYELEMAVNGEATGERHLFARLLIETYAHAKNYDGPLIRRQNIEVQNYHFGLEREWRMIFKRINNKPYLMQHELPEINAFNQQISKERVDFAIGDVYGVTIEQPWQKEEVEKIFMSRFGNKDVKIFFNRVRERWSD